MKDADVKAIARDYGCGDNSCMFGSPGGMATNGGCRCFERPATPEMRKVRHGVAALIVALREARGEVDHLQKLWDLDRAGHKAMRGERDRMREALEQLWAYLQHEHGDWYLKAERREHATRVDAALHPADGGK